jgi:purine-nucleoside phosphorylase
LLSVSTHIGAEPGAIAPTVLLPGDPLRAKWIAETFLDNATCYTAVRGMLGYTGTWQGRPVSVQGSGMGQPSLAIYATELFREYDVRTAIRVGSCGAVTDKLSLRDVVIASGACTDSSMNRLRFHGLDYAPVADFGLALAGRSRGGGGRCWESSGDQDAEQHGHQPTRTRQGRTTGPMHPATLSAPRLFPRV